MRTVKIKAFTIIELLVVISIIALLIGILLPAIGKARDRAYVTRSQSNLRQLAIAHASYATEHNDNQWTAAPHGLAQYGTNLNTAVKGYLDAFANSPKSLQLTDQDKAGIQLGFAHDPVSGTSKDWWWSHPHHHGAILPISFEAEGAFKKSGSFMFINNAKFNPYLGGRFYDSVFYAPKDRQVASAIGACLDAPGQYCLIDGGPFPSSYVLSPAAMYNPDIFSVDVGPNPANIWKRPASLRTPTYGQALYPDLKTHMLEHHQLQFTRRECRSPQIGQHWNYKGCQPYYFNAGRDSVPVTLFYDGHVDLLGHHEVIVANRRHIAQTGKALYRSAWAKQNYWTEAKYLNIPLGSNILEGFEPSSYHILTTDGIRGRDTFSN